MLWPSARGNSRSSLPSAQYSLRLVCARVTRAELQHHAKVRKIVQLATDCTLPASTHNHRYLTIKQLMDRVNLHRKHYTMQRLEAFHLSRRVDSLGL